MEKLLKIKHLHWGIMLSLGLWLMAFAGYNTGISRILEPGFPRSMIDALHGIRAFFPIIAGVLALLFLSKKNIEPDKFFKTPLGLFLIYGIAGIVASVFSNHFIEALYWALMYCSIIMILWFFISENNKEYIKIIIIFNFIIAGLLSIVLLIFFFMQPGVISSLSINHLICSQRPYESIAKVKAGMDVFGMPGTRPTGLARYLGIFSLFLFVLFLCAKDNLKRGLWLSLFVLSLLALFFTQGRMALIAFCIAMIFLLFQRKKIKSIWIIIWFFITAFSALLIFYHIPCQSDVSLLRSLKEDFLPSKTANYNLDPDPITATQKNPDNINKNIVIVSTLSGRTNGVWSDSLELFANSPFIGYGFQADRFFLKGQHTHNSLLHALIQTGLIGTIPFLLATLYIIIFLSRLLMSKIVDKKESFFLSSILAVFIFILVRGITESFAFYGSDMLFLMPIIAYVQILYYENK